MREIIGSDVLATGTHLSQSLTTLIDEPCNLNRCDPGRTGVGIRERTSLVINGKNSKVIDPGFVVAIRHIKGQLDIRSFHSNSKLDPANLSLVPEE